MRNLVIVESAAKAKTIQKYLNEIPELQKKGNFHVIASLGHVSDLPPKELGIDTTKWTAEYMAIPAKKAVISKLQQEAKKADVIYLASDLDMEGEAIANHLKNMLKVPNAHRITFNEITKSALKEAVLNPRRINNDMVHAQEARRILDRVVGYELSPLLWHRFATGSLSAGRVQSVALKMVVDKAKEAKEHEPVPYWNLDGVFDLVETGAALEAKAYPHDDDNIAVWDSEKDMIAVVKHLSKKSSKCVWTASFQQKEAKRNPSAPFTTSSLQQEAYARLGLPAKRTIQIAQGLYEAGYITYMRTDSPALSQDAQHNIQQLIRDMFGSQNVHPRVFKAKAANAQEAHECIRPSKVDVLSKDLDGDNIQPIHKKLYDLIWRRAVASQMAPAIFAEVQYTISSNCCTEVFKGKHSVLVEEGYLKVYNPDQKANKKDLDKWADLLAKGTVQVHANTFTAQGDVTRPPSLYNEPTLVKTLEKEGIGRPSTYATIIDKLFAKGYVIKGSNPQQTVHVSSFKWTKGSLAIDKEEDTLLIGGKDTDHFVPSSLGERVAEYLYETVPFLLNKRFTSQMEEQLDEISDGKKDKRKVLDEFYKPFHGAVEKAQAEHKKIAAEKRKEKKKSGEKAPSGPKNVLRDFERLGIQVVQTRYGPALFKSSEQRFASVIPFMQWKEKTIEELTERDARFLMSLPITFAETMRQVVMGRYGLYVKDGDNNLPLPKELWDKAYAGDLAPKDITSIEHSPAKRFVPSRKKKVAS
jgi:DNA topoisomerase-1